MLMLKKNSFKSRAATLFTVLLVLFLSSCEEVVTLDLETGEPKIVIDAEILWNKGTTGNEQVIKISKMAPYYSATTPKVSGAQVRVENSNGTVFVFNETEPGLYACNDFVPVLNMDYTLYVEVEGKSFRAVEKLISVTPIKRIEQGFQLNASGPDIPEITFYFDDPADQANYYLTAYDTDTQFFPYFMITDDDLTNGNEINNRLADEDLKPGLTVEITHNGISKNFFNYMNLVFEASSWNPFASTPGNIRGNIVNTTNPDDFALGYFRLCESNHVFYTMK
jgi:hypothetical protein